MNSQQLAKKTNRRQLAEREKFWKELDLYSEESAPEIRQSSITYHITISKNWPQASYRPFQLFVSVSRYGDVEEIGGYWYGTALKPHTSENHATFMEVAEYLCEMGYCEWRKIGPEDSELFALPKLTDTK